MGTFEETYPYAVWNHTSPVARFCDRQKAIDYAEYSTTVSEPLRVLDRNNCVIVDYINPIL